jgi:hypothetical protein
MTNCTRKPAEEYVESYLQGTLAEVEAQNFEEHYFDCPICLAQVEALQTVTHALRNEPRIPLKAPIPWPIRIGAFGAIAALLFLGFLEFRTRHQVPQVSVASGPVAPNPSAQPTQPTVPAKPTSPAPSALSSLADMTLPAFQAPNLRGQSGNPQFESGMKAYSSHECPLAIKTLAMVPATDEDSLAARFYSGVCQMHDGDLAPASKTLLGVADAGDSPQQEAALYYLAQIALARNDPSSARQFLTRTISLRGDFERRARSELIKMRADNESK